jgi:hypothetical protein
MSDERPEIIDYIGRALQRLTTEVASLGDEMTVQTAIILRHETTLNGMLEQITAMVSQNARVVDRLRLLEDRVDAISK